MIWCTKYSNLYFHTLRQCLTFILEFFPVSVILELNLWGTYSLSGNYYIIKLKQYLYCFSAFPRTHFRNNFQKSVQGLRKVGSSWLFNSQEWQGKTIITLLLQFFLQFLLLLTPNFRFEYEISKSQLGTKS